MKLTTCKFKCRNLLFVGAFFVLYTASTCPAGQPLNSLVNLDRLSPPKSSFNKLKHASVAGKYLAGRHAQLEQNFKTAAKYFSKALTLDPTNSRILQKTFFSLIATGHISEASVLAKKILVKNKNAPIATLNLVVEDVIFGRYKFAKDRLKSLPKKGINIYTIPLLMSWTEAGNGSTQDAIKALDGLTNIKEFSVLRYMHTGLIYEQAKRYKEADISFRKATEKIKTSRVIQAHTSFLVRNGRGQEAKALYKGFFQQDPASDTFEEDFKFLSSRELNREFVRNSREGMAEVFFNLSETLAQSGSSELALIYGRFALRLYPEFSIAKVLVGGLLESISREKEAIKIYEEVSSQSSLYWLAGLRRASVLVNLGQTDAAVRLLRNFAKERALWAAPLIHLGDLFRIKKRYREAVNAYEKAFKRIGKLRTQHWFLLYARGISYERDKRWESAEEDFLRALEFNPQDPFVLNYLGYSWVDRHIHLDRAKTMIKKAVKLRPKDGYIVDSLGWVLYKLGDYLGATKELEKAVLLKPGDPIINDHLGDAYWRVGRIIEARFQWKRALSLDPAKDQIPILNEKLIKGLGKKNLKDNHT